jgi:hypothetical protein
MGEKMNTWRLLVGNSEGNRLLAMGRWVDKT